MVKLSPMVGFLVTTHPDAAKKFFTEMLGFRLLTDDMFALAFDANGAMLRVGKAQTFVHSMLSGPATKGCYFRIADELSLVEA